MRAILALTCLLLLIPTAEDESTWEHLARLYDTNGDGLIERLEYRLGDELWSRLDHDADGVLTWRDIEALRRREHSGDSRSQ